MGKLVRFENFRTDEDTPKGTYGVDADSVELVTMLEISGKGASQIRMKSGEVIIVEDSDMKALTVINEARSSG
jgi:hypothetical protein